MFCQFLCITDKHKKATARVVHIEVRAEKNFKVQSYQPETYAMNPFLIYKEFFFKSTAKSAPQKILTLTFIFEFFRDT